MLFIFVFKKLQFCPVFPSVDRNFCPLLFTAFYLLASVSLLTLNFCCAFSYPPIFPPQKKARPVPLVRPFDAAYLLCNPGQLVTDL